MTREIYEARDSLKAENADLHDSLCSTWTQDEAIAWAVDIWCHKLHNDQRTGQKWLDLVASCRSLCSTDKKGTA